MLKALIFDLDHTLYDYPACNQAGQTALFAFLSERLEISERRARTLFQAAREHVHDTLPTQAASHSRLLYSQHVIEVVLKRTNPALTLQAEEIFWRAYLGAMKLRPGLLQLLQRARAQGLRIAIASDLTTAIQLRKLQRLRITQYIDYVVTSEEVGHEKPHPAMLQRALAKLQCRADEVIYIGDSLTRDRVVARRLHLPFRLVVTNQAVEKLSNELFGNR